MILSTMTEQRLIVLLTCREDETSDRLQTILQRQHVPVLRLDTGDFPSRVTLDAHFSGANWHGTLRQDGQIHHLETIRSILYRRPMHYRMNDELLPTHQDFCEHEAAHGFGGLLRSLNCLWVSHPDALRAAGYKPRQLSEAALAGFRIPRTLLTNDPAAVHSFFDECQGEVIYKPLHFGFIPVNLQEYESIYTSRLTREHLKELERVRFTAHLFQEYIPKRLELRVTIIGQRIFTVGIHSQHSERARVDWRAGYDDLRYSVERLPAVAEQHCLELLRRLNLHFGCLDLIETPDGSLVFLEINPAGQFGWVEQATGLPMSETLVDFLIHGEASYDALSPRRHLPLDRGNRGRHATFSGIAPSISDGASPSLCSALLRALRVAR